MSSKSNWRDGRRVWSKSTRGDLFQIAAGFFVALYPVEGFFGFAPQRHTFKSSNRINSAVIDGLK
jgi:hypothetical protein